ncbi:MAG: hypothetical protein Q9200_004667 [Gallowayella weberi]
MPRLPSHLRRHAYSIDPLLPLLLRSCRTLPSAINELRWLREHLLSSFPQSHAAQRLLRDRLHKLCLERSRGRPLQYILGDQPFGELLILCRKGVLIPRSAYPSPLPSINRAYTNILSVPARPETETWVTHLTTHVLQNTYINSQRAKDEPLRILDLCTGTGCISLLLYSLLHSQYPFLQILGVDISPTAIRLAQRNLTHNISNKLLPVSASTQIQFLQGDIFAEERAWQKSPYDIVVSNPPYVSPAGYNHTTTRSVRNYEPKLALVPNMEHDSDVVVGDAFYPHIVSLAEQMNASMIAVEVGDTEQARRIARMIGKRQLWRKLNVWGDGILDDGNSRMEAHHSGILPFTAHGTGEGRAVAAW